MQRTKFWRSAHLFLAASVACSIFLSCTASVRAEQAADAMVRLFIVDSTGRERQAEAAVISLSSGEAVAGGTGTLTVPAGAYLIEPEADPMLAIDIDLEPGEERDVRINARGALWLEPSMGTGTAAPILFRPTSEEDARTILRALEPRFLVPHWRTRRGGASDSEVEAALEAGRAILAGRPERPKNGAGDGSFPAWRAAATESVLALASGGTAGDADLLAGLLQDRSLPPAEVLKALAMLEQRLGTLEADRVAVIAADPQAGYLRDLAISLLAHYGVESARERLIARAQEEPLDLRFGTDILVGVDDPRVDQIANAALWLASVSLGEGGEDISGIAKKLPAALWAYLLVFGTPAQKAVLAESLGEAPEWKQRRLLVDFLAPLAQDPRPLIRLLARAARYDNEPVNNDLLLLCPAFRARGEAAFEHLVDAIVDEAGRAVSEVAVDPDAVYRHVDSLYRYLLLPCRPDPSVGKLIYENEAPRRRLDEPALIDPNHWIAPDLSEAAIRNLMTRWPPTKTARLVGDLDSDLVSPAWLEIEEGWWSFYRPERISLHRGFARAAYDPAVLRVNDGIERRLYAFRDITDPKNGQGYSGAVVGHLEVHPTVRDGRIAIGLRLNPQPYYHLPPGFGLAALIEMGEDAYASRTGWKIHRFIADGGRRLIETVKLARGDRSVPLSKAGFGEDGFFWFETGLPGDDWTGLVLTVDLGLPRDHRSFQFPLFASAAARNRGGSP